MFGQRAHEQRCRTHKLRNVLERLPKTEAAQTKAVMMAAYRLQAKDGTAKTKKQAQWLEREHPDAAASLLEGLHETFTVNALGLPPSLMRCLCTTNIIENPNGIVRRTSRRVTRYRDADMALRWSAAGLLEAQKSFRSIQGVKDMWILQAALGRPIKQVRVDKPKKAAYRDFHRRRLQLPVGHRPTTPAISVVLKFHRMTTCRTVTQLGRTQMATIDHFDGSSTSIDQESDGSWAVVTIDSNGNAGGAQGFGSGYTAQELTEKYTYPNDVVNSSSVEHDDGSSTVFDQLASGGWSVYSVDANGDRGPSHEYGDNYTREELEAGSPSPDAGAQMDDSAPVQADPQPSDPAPTEASAPDPPSEASPEQEASPSEGGAAGEGEGEGGEGKGGGGGGGGGGGMGDEGGGA